MEWNRDQRLVQVSPLANQSIHFRTSGGVNETVRGRVWWYSLVLKPQADDRGRSVPAYGIIIWVLLTTIANEQESARTNNFSDPRS